MSVSWKIAISLYADSEFPVSNEIAAIHERQFNGLVAPGTWFSGPERRAIAAEARKACYEAGLLEASPDGAEEPDIDLPESTRSVVHTIATSVLALNQPFFDQAIVLELYFDFVEVLSYCRTIRCAFGTGPCRCRSGRTYRRCSAGCLPAC